MPVLLSVGYAACHWCHVMAHESFEDVATAEQINAGFVAVKVDREERPDIDAVYMAATQAMTGQGGWPMTCFLTPAGEPFHCGTYYPTAHFRRLLAAVTQAWADDGARVRSSAGQIAARLADNAAAALPPAGLGAEALDAAVQALAGEFDAVNGGFGGAPKFPPSMTLEFLLRHHERTGSGQALHLATTTAGRMARGGMYDQLAGGFARYSVDARWVVPHFEKMLYDNALLLRVYAHLARIAGPQAALARRVAEETAEFLLRDLRTPEGGFASALDADTDGVEGLTYAWTPAAADGGPRREGRCLGRAAARGDAGGHLRARLVDPAAAQRIPTIRRAGGGSAPRCSPRGTGARSPHGTTRSSRHGTAWRCSPSPRRAPRWAGQTWVAAADATADLLLDAARRGRPRAPLVARRRRRCRSRGAGGPRLPRRGAARAASGHGRGAPAGAGRRGARPDPGALHRRRARAGAFFDTADDAEALLHRPREITDNATPSGAAALAGALLTASVLVDDPQRYRDTAEAALRTAGTLARRFPRFAGHWLTVAEAAARGPLQVAVVGIDTDRDALAGHARAIAPGGTVVVAGTPDAPGYRCSPTGRSSTAPPRPTSAAASSAIAPSATVDELTAALLLTP